MFSTRSAARVLSCVLIVLSVSVVNCYRKETVQLLEDIVKIDELPTSFILKTCWTVQENLWLMKNLPYPISFIKNADFEISTSEKANEAMFVLDMNCTDSLQFLMEVNEKYFASPFRWIIIRSNSNQDNITIEALPDSNIVIATWDEQDTFQLQQIYKLGILSNTMLYEQFGIWNTTNGITDMRVTSILSRRRRDLQGYTLTASCVLMDNNSFNHLHDYKDKTVDSVSKVTYLLFFYLFDVLNVTKNFRFHDTWGYYNPVTKDINGMIGDVLKKKADVTGTPLFIVAERVPTLEFVSMPVSTRARFVFRAPPLSFITNIYYLPFEPSVWTSGCLLVVISCAVIYLTFKASHTRFSMYFTSEEIRFSDILLFAVAAISQMGSHIEPKFFSGRISATFFFVSLLFLYTAYTANIVSLLQATTKSIKTLDDLYQSQMKWGVQDTPYSRNFFPQATGAIRKEVYSKKIVPANQPSAYMNMTYGISRIRQGYFTFHCEIGIGYKHIEDTFYEHEKCGLIEINYLQVKDPWVCIQKHSPYTEVVKVNLFKIREHGIQYREYAKMYTKKPQCSAHGQNFESVRLIDCYMLILILVYGYSLAIIVFILEKIIFAKFRASQLCLQ